jgi:2-oxoglutarate ferredoxin oxidoreductase subunit gamma
MMKQRRYEIRIAGSGGQGVILAAIILAEAAGHYEGLFAAQSQNYGPEARGGYSMAEVVLSREPIDYPSAIRPDVLLAMNQEGFNRYLKDVKENGFVVVDETNITHVPEGRIVKLPITDTAIKETGRMMVANIVALGVLCQLTKVVSRGSLEAAILDRVPKGTKELNMKAFEAGIRLAKKVDLNTLPPSSPEELTEDL